MKLSTAAKQFQNGHLDKQKYILQAHEAHALLFDYCEMLKGSQIAVVELSKAGLLLKTENGVTFTVDPKDLRAAPIEAINFGSYELEFENMMLQLLTPGSTMFDIGANIGWYSIRFAKQIEGLKVFSFEPAPATFAYLTKNIALNAADGVTPVQLALSDKKAKQNLFFSQNMAVNASLANINPVADTAPVEVEVTTLDSFVAKHKPVIDFIKCDVEGAEFLVFKGAQDTLRNQKPAIACEMLRKWSAGFGYHPNEIILYMKGFGYDCYTFRDGKLTQFRAMDEKTQETNFFFLDPAKHAELIRKNG